MSQDLNEIMPSTDERMDIDTSFLDAYRTGGSDGLKKAQARALEQEESGKDLQPNPDAASGDLEREGSSTQHGGSGSSGATGTAASQPGEAAAPQAHDDAEDLSDATDVLAPPMPPHAEANLTPPVPLQHTDHQEAVQSAAARGGSDGGDEGDSVTLPQTGFRLSGVKSQPAVRALPEVLVGTLREQLRSAAVREFGASDAAAREFTERLSQASLVTAFLLAQLDLGLDVDAATRRAAQLFRSRDPLLGSIAARMENLERRERERNEGLAGLREQVGEVKDASAAIEQALAYSIADRTSNFLRGSHNIHDAPIIHKDALFVRDKVREETKKQARIEREREGRPIR
ncbi:hypothetical protein [Pseudarthrobacter sp. GA104]|uniref:hypothetical protein n=1 Tax=Pseudarthrobacter sp. GA104 TaxID=2676311 RepID=UPI001380B3BA|nr:hypothetical protein [Pseudarthrobacter sp. GA104]MUU73395.1 hypothetical protein [Pseudarthrobacter sp. GA104]